MVGVSEESRGFIAESDGFLEEFRVRVALDTHVSHIIERER